MQIEKITNNFRNLSCELRCKVRRKFQWVLYQIYKNLETISPLTYLLPDLPNLYVNLRYTISNEVYMKRVGYLLMIFLNLYFFALLFTSFFENCFVVLILISDTNKTLENLETSEITLVNQEVNEISFQEENVELSSRGSWASIGTLE